MHRFLHRLLILITFSHPWPVREYTNCDGDFQDQENTIKELIQEQRYAKVLLETIVQGYLFLDINAYDGEDLSKVNFGNNISWLWEMNKMFICSRYPIAFLNRSLTPAWSYPSCLEWSQVSILMIPTTHTVTLSVISHASVSLANVKFVEGKENEG